jgi:hypothetical protein
VSEHHITLSDDDLRLIIVALETLREIDEDDGYAKDVARTASLISKLGAPLIAKLEQARREEG